MQIEVRRGSKFVRVRVWEGEWDTNDCIWAQTVLTNKEVDINPLVVNRVVDQLEEKVKVKLNERG